MNDIGIPIQITRNVVVIKRTSGFDAMYEYVERVLGVLMEAKTRNLPCRITIDYGCIIVKAELVEDEDYDAYADEMDEEEEE